MKYWLWVGCSWLAVFVVAINILTMYARTGYSASWTKVAIFTVFAVFYAALARTAKELK